MVMGLGVGGVAMTTSIGGFCLVGPLRGVRGGVAGGVGGFELVFVTRGGVVT